MGLFALGGFADRVGLTEALSAAVPRRGERAPVHDRGRVLVHALLMLADPYTSKLLVRHGLEAEGRQSGSIRSLHIGETGGRSQIGSGAKPEPAGRSLRRRMCEFSTSQQPCGP